MLQRLLTLAALAVAFFFSAGLVMYFAMRGHEVQVPSVVGQSEVEAVETIEGLGLRVRVRHSAPHARVPAGAVSEQSPSAGTTVKTGQIVGLTLSLGAPKAAERAEAMASPVAAGAR